MNKRESLINELEELGFEYKCHKGGMHSKYRASEFVNANGETKYLYEEGGVKFWIEDTWRNVQSDFSLRKHGVIPGYVSEIE